MGAYIYGVSSKKKTVKGFSAPVFELVYIVKPWFDGVKECYGSAAMTIGRMQAKPSMRGSLVSYELSNMDMPAFPIMEYNGIDNVFYDSATEKTLKVVGYAKRVGKKLVRIEKDEYERMMIAEAERNAEYAF